VSVKRQWKNLLLQFGIIMQFQMILPLSCLIILAMNISSAVLYISLQNRLINGKSLKQPFTFLFLFAPTLDSVRIL